MFDEMQKPLDMWLDEIQWNELLERTEFERHVRPYYDSPDKSYREYAVLLLKSVGKPSQFKQHQKVWTFEDAVYHVAQMTQWEIDYKSVVEKLAAPASGIVKRPRGRPRKDGRTPTSILVKSIEIKKAYEEWQEAIDKCNEAVVASAESVKQQTETLKAQHRQYEQQWRDYVAAKRDVYKNMR